MFKPVEVMESLVPSKVNTGFPFSAEAVRVGWFAAVDCSAWLPLPLLSFHWLTELDE